MVRNAKDSVLTTLVKARLTADRYVKGRNINVESHDGIVYLLSRPHSQLVQLAGLTKLFFRLLFDLPAAERFLREELLLR